MNVLNPELYDALTSAGADDTKARAAATAVVGAESRFNALGKQINSLEKRMLRLEGRFNLLQWMMGFNLAMTVALLWQVLMLGQALS